MRNECTAVCERDEEWYVTYCPEIPGANGQGLSKEEAVESLRNTIALILEDRREDGLRGVPDDAERGIDVSSEAFGAAALLAAPRLPPQAGGRIPLAVDEPPEWSGGGSARHTEIPDLLARKICRGLGVPEIGR